MALSDDLLAQAGQLARLDGAGRPKQANLRRAVSAAYYALFHEITSMVAAQVVGRANVAAPLGARVSRTVTHANVKKAAQQFTSAASASPAFQSLRTAMAAPGTTAPAPCTELATLCRHVPSLQQARHDADYDLLRRFNREEALRRVDEAIDGVRLVRALPADSDTQVFLLGCLLGDALYKNH
ncbi:MAG: hypothetical protein ACKVS8_12065 [Phycisphaerales bacterium]